MASSSHKEEHPRGFRAWLRHAFAVEKYDESSLSEDDKEVLSRLANQIGERRLAPAAILWIQSNRHMNWLTSQALVAFQPIFDMTHIFVNAFSRHFGLYISPADFPKLHSALEKRYSIEYFIQRLEAYAAGDYNERLASHADASTDGGSMKEQSSNGQHKHKDKD